MSTAAQLREAVRQATSRLTSWTAEDAARLPAPGKWSAKQILGHLIDSAVVNVQRFVRAQLADDLCYDTYLQAEFVAVQRYQDADWSGLVELWSRLNLRLAEVIEAVPPETANRLRARHNLHQIAFETVPEDEPTTLAYFMRDYVAHLRHHLAQIDAVGGAADEGEAT